MFNKPVDRIHFFTNLPISQGLYRVSKEISFDWKKYLENYPDLTLAGIRNEQQAFNHYKRFGKAEGRSFI